MDIYSRDFGLFIDGLRLERNLSREELCDDIMSLSQYKRYLRGDTSIPNSRLVQIADKLKFSITEIHHLYENKHGKQLQNIEMIYTEMVSHRYQEALKLAQDLREEVFISNYNKLFYDFCVLYVQHALMMVSDIHVLELYSTMINYPECRNNGSFNWVELSILFQIIHISSRIDNYEPVDFMFEILRSDQYSFSVSKDTSLLPTIYLTIAQILGKRSMQKEAIEIVEKGIDHCLKYGISHALASMFIVHSFAKLDVGEKDEALDSAKKAFMQLHIENKPKKIAQFKKMFSKRFEMNADEIFNI